MQTGFHNHVSPASGSLQPSVHVVNEALFQGHQTVGTPVYNLQHYDPHPHHFNNNMYSPTNPMYSTSSPPYPSNISMHPNPGYNYATGGSMYPRQNVVYPPGYHHAGNVHGHYGTLNSQFRQESGNGNCLSAFLAGCGLCACLTCCNPLQIFSECFGDAIPSGIEGEGVAPAAVLDSVF